MSSLSRAFTTRKAKMNMNLDMSDLKTPHRSSSTREHRLPILRHKISAPIQLVHTTNMLSYNAPDLPRPSPAVSTTAGSITSSSTASSSLSTKSDADSEVASTAGTESTPPTSPDVSPTSECPSPEPNHLSTYFMAPEKVHASPNTPNRVAEPPAIPQRSPSHTKKNSYDAIARSRSVSRMSKESDRTLSSKASFSFSRSSSTSTRASSVSSTSNNALNQKPSATAGIPTPPMPSPTPKPFVVQRSYPKEAHPFGQELAQVTELAEEYATKSNSALDEEDDHYIKARGLVKFVADDYLNDIQGIFSSFFTGSNDTMTAPQQHARTAAPLWI